MGRLGKLVRVGRRTKMWHRIGVSGELGKIVLILPGGAGVLATNYRIFDWFMVHRAGVCISCGQFYFLPSDLASQGPPSSSNALVYVSSSYRIFGYFCLCNILQNVSFQAPWAFELHPFLFKWMALQIWGPESTWKQREQHMYFRSYVPYLLLHCPMHRLDAYACKAIPDEREFGANLYRSFNIVFIYYDDSSASIATRPPPYFTVHSDCKCVAGICYIHWDRCNLDSLRMY